MHVLITGAAGMIGRKITERLLADGRIGRREVTKLTLHDIVDADGASRPSTSRSARSSATSPTAQLIERLLAEKPDIVIHLAAIVSGEAEADFDKGYARQFRRNAAPPRCDPAAERTSARRLRLVDRRLRRAVSRSDPRRFPPDAADQLRRAEGGRRVPAQRLHAARLLRRDRLRLPTICVRPGKPNKAASGFFSGIIREPLKGEEALLPVADSVLHWHASPRAAVGFFMHAAEMDLAPIGPRRCLTMPGVGATVGEQIEALRKVAGEKAVKLIRREPDPVVERIVAGWPTRFEAKRSRDLGFTADESFEAIVRAHIEDEHGGRAPIMD